MKRTARPLVWLHGEIRTPPFSPEARMEAGFLLRRLQGGETIMMPHLRPMPDIGPRCHELRIGDADAIVILGIFSKKTQTTPKTVLEACKRRMKEYDDA